MEQPINKTYIIHACVIFLFIGLCGLFFILGGGTNTSVEGPKMANIDTIPDIMVEGVATNKIDAYRQAEALAEREMREKKLQNEHNSFDFFTKQLENPETTVKKEEQDLSQKAEENEKAVAELSSSMKRGNRGSSARQKQSDEEEEIDYDKLMEEEKRKKREEIREIITPKEPEKKPTSNNSPFKPINKKSASANNNVITAVIHGEQRNITSSSIVKLRTQQDFEINGTTIPRNTIVYGKAQISTNKVKINIDQIIYKDTPYPFKGRIYDLNGSEGLYIPDNAVNEGIKDGTGDMISETDVSIKGSSVTGLISSGANALTHAVKRMADNKNKEVKVTLSANYRLIIVMD